MKVFIATISLWVAFCGHVLSQTKLPSFPNGIVTLSGQRYEDVKVDDVFTNDRTVELRIIYVKPSGVEALTAIDVDDLPPTLKNLCEPYKTTSLSPISKTNQLLKSVQNIIVGAPSTVSLELSNGVVLEIIKIDSIEPDGINVAYLQRGQMGYVGHGKVPFELLSGNVQTMFHYDPAAAATYRKMIADNAEAQIKAEEDKERIAAQQAERQKEELDLEIKIQQLQALQAQADAAQRQADAQERAADAQENQALSQQQINGQLQDLNWQLIRLRQENQY